MEIKIDEITVIFPFPYIYPEQLDYMKALKGALDESLDKLSRQAFLEMPTGTGKTISLLSLIIAYQEHHKLQEKFIYCCRTINEVTNVADTLKMLMTHRQAHAPSQFNTDYKYVYMASRDHLCRHTIAESVTDTSQLKHHPLEQCPYYEASKDAHIAKSGPEFLNFDDYLLECNKAHICPYYYSREQIALANLVVCPYQYVLDPSVRAITGSAFLNSIVVFDEAHNIDSIALDTFSLRLGRKDLNLAGQYVVELAREIASSASKFASALKAETEALKAEIAELKEALADAESEIAWLDAELVKYDEMLEIKHEQLTQLKGEISSLKGELADSNKKLSDTQAALEEANGEVIKANDAVGKLKKYTEQRLEEIPDELVDVDSLPTLD